MLRNIDMPNDEYALTVHGFDAGILAKVFPRYIRKQNMSDELLNLSGKTAIITGGGSGIGREVFCDA